MRSSIVVSFLSLYFLTRLAFYIHAIVDQSEAIVFQDLYVSLNYPSQLKKWKPLGGDPCSELWTGVSCLESSITHIDLSSNNIQGVIPYSFPLNVTHINLACNNFTQNIPHSLTNLSALRYLNLSHYSLNGPIGDFNSNRRTIAGEMGPAIQRSISAKALSQFADIISMCIQLDKEYRPPVSEIVESLTRLIEGRKPGTCITVDTNRSDPIDRSFRSTHTGFMGSPTLTTLST